jgi:hypothetical protein
MDNPRCEWTEGELKCGSEACIKRKAHGQHVWKWFCKRHDPYTTPKKEKVESNVAKLMKLKTLAKKMLQILGEDDEKGKKGEVYCNACGHWHEKPSCGLN